MISTVKRWKAPAIMRRLSSSFKHAISLDPSQLQAIPNWRSVLEKNGDWVSALEQYRKPNWLKKREPPTTRQEGSLFCLARNAEDGHKARSYGYQRYLASLKAEGKSGESGELEKQVQAMDAAPTAKKDRVGDAGAEALIRKTGSKPREIL